MVGAFVGLATLSRLRSAMLNGRVDAQQGLGASRPDAGRDEGQKLATALPSFT
jgi:hypothetical protein